MSVSIRVATKSDMPAILALYAQPELDDGKTLSLSEAENLLSKIKSYPNYKIYVAEIEESMVGTFALLIMDNIGHLGAPSGLVEQVAVAPAWQGRDVGKSMMDYARKICREAGCYKIALSSNLKRERTHTFYESLGFKKHGFSFCVDTMEGSNS